MSLTKLAVAAAKRKLHRDAPLRASKGGRLLATTRSPVNQVIAAIVKNKGVVKPEQAKWLMENKSKFSALDIERVTKAATKKTRRKGIIKMKPEFEPSHQDGYLAPLAKSKMATDNAKKGSLKRAKRLANQRKSMSPNDMKLITKNATPEQKKRLQETYTLDGDRVYKKKPGKQLTPPSKNAVATQLKKKKDMDREIKSKARIESMRVGKNPDTADSVNADITPSIMFNEFKVPLKFDKKSDQVKAEKIMKALMNKHNLEFSLSKKGGSSFTGAGRKKDAGAKLRLINSTTMRAATEAEKFKVNSQYREIADKQIERFNKRHVKMKKLHDQKKGTDYNGHPEGFTLDSENTSLLSTNSIEDQLIKAAEKKANVRLTKPQRTKYKKGIKAIKDKDSKALNSKEHLQRMLQILTNNMRRHLNGVKSSGHVRGVEKLMRNK